MKATRALTAVLAVLLLSFATGCWNRRELNDLAITVGLGIDKADSNQFRVSAQVVEPSEIAGQKGSSRAPVNLYTETGSTVEEALRKMTERSPRKIYLAHLRVLVIGESLAREGMVEALDHLLRSHEVRTDFYVAVAKGEHAEKLLKVMTPLEKLPSVKLFESMDISEKYWAPSLTVTLDKLLADLLSKGKHPVLASIELKGDAETGNKRSNLEQIDVPAYLSSAGLAVFKGDRLLGWLNEDESKGHNYITDKITYTHGYISCPKGGKIGMQVIRSYTKVTARIEHGEPVAEVEVRVKQNVGEVTCKIDLTQTETLAELDKRSSQRIQGFIDAAIDKAQQTFKSDIFGFGEAVHRAEPKAWKRLETDWDRHFANMRVDVKVLVQTTLLGTENNSLINKMKE